MDVIGQTLILPEASIMMTRLEFVGYTILKTQFSPLKRFTVKLGRTGEFKQ